MILIGRTTARTDDRIWTPPRLTSEWLIGDGDDCARIFGLWRWHALMPGHDGYAHARSQSLFRTRSTRSITGLTGVGSTVSPSSTVLGNRE